METNNVENGITQHDDTKMSKIKDKILYFISNYNIIVEAFLAIITVLIILKNEVLAFTKGLLYNIPSYYFVQSTILEKVFFAIFLLIAIIVIVPIFKSFLSSSNIRFVDFLPFTIVYVTGLILYIKLSVFIVILNQAESINKALDKYTYQINCKILIVVLVLSVILIILYNIKNRIVGKLSMILKSICYLLGVVVVSYILSTSIFYTCFYFITYGMQYVEDRKNYELITSLDEENEYDVVITTYGDRLVVMSGYVDEELSVLYIEKSKGFRVIERNDNQNINYVIFQLVDFQ